MTHTQFMNWLPTLLEGIKMTLIASFLSIFTAIVWGSAVAFLEELGNKVLTPILLAYVSIFRNSPLLVFMFLFFYGLPYVGITMSPLLTGVLAITLNEGAFVAEILRGSILNIPSSEIEAAYSLGLSKFQVVGKIIFPLAIRTSLPMLTGQSSIVIKDTSLLSLIMILDLTRAGTMFYSQTFNTSSIGVIAVIYVIIFLGFSNLGHFIEKKVVVKR